MEKESFEKFLLKIEEIAAGLQNGGEYVNSVFINDVTSKSRNIKEYAEEILNTDRDLRIGIVGQVKAGKSSFLNALIFDGESILPKAATPMTAALTKVSYAKDSAAKVVYYSKKDWEVVQELSEMHDKEYERLKSNWESEQRQRMERLNKASAEGGPEPLMPGFLPRIERELKNKISPQWRACKELTEMAKPQVLAKLGTEQDLSIASLKDDLEEYVGAAGDYTPIVKYIELKIANDLLRDIQIIDTPGLGDPIMSRSEKTKEFLMACDVVFLLSPTPQFMSREDVELMTNTLPADSVNHVVLVGSKFDSVLLDDPGRGRERLSRVMRRTVDNLNNSAFKTITDSRRAEKSYTYSQVLKRLEEEAKKQIQEEGKLYYVSPLLYNAAVAIEKGKTIEPEAEKSISELEKRFEGMNRDSPFLRDFSMIEEIRSKEFVKIRHRKEEILAERCEAFLKEQRIAFSKMLNGIQAEAEQNLNMLKTEDMDALLQKLKTSKDALSSMRREIQNEFDLCALDAHRYLVELANDIRTRINEHTDIVIREGSEEVDRKVGERGWWIFKKGVYRTDTVYYKAANVSDVITNIINYINASERDISNDLDKAINITTIRNQIKDIVLKAFYKADADFDENTIIGPLKKLLAQLTLPKFSIVDVKKYQEKIISEFPNASVRGEEIAHLEQQQTIVLREIADDICEELEKKANEISQSLNEQGANFTDDVKLQIVETIERLEKNVHDKESGIKRIEDFIRLLERYKKELRAITID